MSEIAGLFAGIGFCVFMCVLSYFFYQVVRSVKADSDYDEKLFTLKGLLMDKIAKTKGIELEKE